MGYALHWFGVLFSFFTLAAVAVERDLPSVELHNNSLVLKWEFPAARFSPSADGTDVQLGNLPIILDAGMPRLPFAHVNIALPEGTELKNVEHESRNISATIGTPSFNRGMLPISWLNRRHPSHNGPTVMDLPGTFPIHGTTHSLQKKHGVSMVSLNVFPVRYEPAAQRLSWTKLFTVRINFTRTSELSPALTQEQARSVARIVHNPEAIWQRFDRNSRTANYDYLIIATKLAADYSGANDLRTFQTHLANRGLGAKIVYLSEALMERGKSNAEKLRNFIRKEYSDNAIRFVLLIGKAQEGGSDEIIPHQRLWSRIKAYFGSWVNIEEQIPADLYFANLDGTFDGNDNGKYGETTDGENGGDVDFLSEVSVGRVVIDTPEQIENFVQKSIWAAENQLPKKTLLMGEELFPELDLSGIDYLSKLVGTSNDHAFTTSGYSPQWSVDQLNDRQKVWTGKDALSQLNEHEYTMVNHLGHSNVTLNMRLSWNLLNHPNFKNAHPFFYYTQGCLAGRFIEGSFVDKMVSHSAAAFAAIGNSMYGLAPEDPAPETTNTPGASNLLHRQYIHALSTGAASTLGEAHQASKEALLNYQSAQEIRWVDWIANYFGDPSLPTMF